MIEIDGSFGEGGGQILRTSLTLSAIFNKAIVIENIRAKRSKPGLRPQHLTCVRAMAKVTGAKVEGAEIGSKNLCFHPSAILQGNYLFDVAEKRKSAGSVALIFQTLLLPLSLAKGISRVTIKGGTHVPWSPPFDYLSKVFLPTVSRMGICSTLDIIRCGWYPEGGGEVRAVIHPIRSLKSIFLTERAQSLHIEVTCASSNLPSHIIDRENIRIESRLKERGLKVAFRTLDVPAVGQGNAVFLCAKNEHTIAGFSSLGKRGKKAETVADEVADAFFHFLDGGASVDTHLSDQLLPYMALAQGTCAIFSEQITQHLLTNIWAIQKFGDISFQVEGNQGEKGKVTKISW